MAQRSFGTRLAFAFAAVAFISAVMAGALAWAGWTWQFNRYVTGTFAEDADSWASFYAISYMQNGGWGDWLAMTPRASMRGVALQLTDANGEILLQDVGMRRYIGESAIQPSGPVVSQPVLINGERVGTVTIWSPQSNQLRSTLSEQFRRASLFGVLLAAAIAIAAASTAGYLYARRIVRPVEKVTATAQALRSGDRAARTGLSGEDEIGILGRTFDEMADAIEADREMERRLTADVAHELRTPLQAIQATVEAMQDGVMPADEEHLGVVRDETVRLARLAEGILELTRLERRTMPFEHELTDVGDVARIAVDAHRALFESAELVLSVDIADGVAVFGDPDRLRQAVGNLLSNAARYTPPGGRVEVSVRAEAGQAVIEVADTGIGIAEEDLPFVFSRFWRADDARARTTGGLGIGLAVVREIVDRHGGTVGVSQRTGGGSVFSVRLPLAFG